MPDAQGRYNLGDFVVDLQQRGFDGFKADELRLMVNRAYFAVAKKSRWEWEKATVTFDIGPGQPSVGCECTPGSILPYFRTLERLYKTTSGHAGKMTIMREDDFFQNWLGKDFTQQNTWNEPSQYFIYDDKLWLLSPPTATRTFVAYYVRRPVALMTDSDFPITPQHLDEAIIDSARVRAHTRANEPNLAVSARSDLEEAYDDMRDDEEEDMHEHQERVVPDRSWL
jgi:hypothetical protein